MPNTQNPFAAKPAAVNPFAGQAEPPFDPAGELDDLLDRAAELRDRKAELVKAIDAERAEVAARIVHLSGGRTGQHEVGARTYTLRRPSTRRSTDYSLLESMYPAAYAAAVKVTEPAPDALPTLILGKGFKR